MTAKTVAARGARMAADKQLPVRVERILVAVDFSPSSKNAFRHAIALANHFESQLMVLHVVSISTGGAFAATYGIPQFSPDELTTAEKNLNGLLRSAQLEDNRTAKPILRLGLPAHEICEAAKEANADLLVIGTHGYTGWKHFCIGSTAERVVRAAPCPVLVVREKEDGFVTGGVMPC